MKTVGGSKVDSVDSLHPQAIQANAAIETASRFVQDGIWWFNMEEDTYPDVNKTILKVKTGDKTLVWRGTGFRDIVNHTDLTPDKVTCEYVSYLLDFEMLPESVASLVMYTAAEEFIRSEIGDEDKIRGNSMFVKTAALKAKTENMDNLNVNHNEFPRVKRVRGRIRPHWRPRN